MTTQPAGILSIHTGRLVGACPSLFLPEGDSAAVILGLWRGFERWWLVDGVLGTIKCRSFQNKSS